MRRNAYSLLTLASILNSYDLNKIVIGNQEFLVLSQPLKIFLKLYGASIHLMELISLRTELYTWEHISARQINVVFDLLTNFIPIQLGFRPLYIYNLMYLEYANSYRTYRHLFNLPVNGQRT